MSRTTVTTYKCDRCMKNCELAHCVFFTASKDRFYVASMGGDVKQSIDELVGKRGINLADLCEECVMSLSKWAKEIPQ